MRDSRHEILHFWFEETEPAQWFQKNETFDAQLRDRFLQTYTMARDGLCDDWKQNAEGCLALILLLDQFPRNMFRDAPEAFATDGKALVAAKFTIARGYDQVLPFARRRFVYLPFEHSENLSDQKRSVQLFETMADEDPLSLEYARRHMRVIEQFGRFPHRNKILGRDSTPEEEAYLATPGAGF
jgi:uncharacterized protein (DUF924 family)